MTTTASTSWTPGVDDAPLALASDEPSDDLVAVLREILSTVVRPTGA